jgi:hypothetical protein
MCVVRLDRPAWLMVCHFRSIAASIWDELVPSYWDQRLLCRRCKYNRQSTHSSRRTLRVGCDKELLLHLFQHRNGLLLAHRREPFEKVGNGITSLQVVQ